VSVDELLKVKLVVVFLVGVVGWETVGMLGAVTSTVQLDEAAKLARSPGAVAVTLKL
jgi:hypothetical protein